MQITIEPSASLSRRSRIEITRAVIRPTAVFCADFVSLAFALLVGTPLRELAKIAGLQPVLSILMQNSAASHFISFFSVAVLLLYWFASGGQYVRPMPFWEQIKQIIKVLLTGFATQFALLVLLSGARIDWQALLTTWTVAVVAVPLGRIHVQKFLLWCGLWSRDAVIVGLGENARDTHAALIAERLMGFEVKWFADVDQDSSSARSDSPTRFQANGRSYPVITLSGNPAPTLSRLGNPAVIVALDSIVGQEGLVWELGAANQEAWVVPAIRGLSIQGAGVTQFFGRGLFLLQVRNRLADSKARLVKRLFDIVVAAALVVMLVPFWCIIGFLVSRDKGPALYGHTRVGLRGERFACLKFRSMLPNADRILNELLERDPKAREEWQRDYKLKNDPRITRIGAFLRKTSLDELPQLFNVLKGDMSLVGPRPIVQDELSRYGLNGGYYLQVRPGITGIWQVSGRNDVDYTTRVNYDAWYVKNWSLWTDVVILFKTVRVVLGRVGAY